MNNGSSLFITGLLGFLYLVVVLCIYSDTTRIRFSVEAGRKIFTSGEETFHRERGEETFHRERGKLVRNEEILTRKTVPPVFFYPIDGQDRQVVMKFTTPVRILRMLVLAAIALFLPVIVAFPMTGFDVSKLNLAGSAVWFCIAVPVVPIYLLKFGIVELHEHPWLYTVSKNGRKKHYRKKPKIKHMGHSILAVLKYLFVPPVSLAVWFGIISFFVMVYLTAGGF